MTAEAPSRTTPGVRLSWVDLFLWAIRIGSIVVLIWGITGTVVGGAGETSADGWRDLAVAAVAQGFMYGMIALGYSMVYGVLGFINFAHGEVFMAGGMVGFFAANMMFDNGLWASNFALAFVIVILVAMIGSTATAVIVERVAYRPLRGAPRIIPLITSIGISFFLQYAFAGLFGVGVRNYPQPPEWIRTKQSILGLQIEGAKFLVIVISIASMIILWFFVEKTKTGRAMRAVAEDKEIAALMGINIDRTIVTTFAVGGAMAGIAGVLWALLFRSVSFVTGFLPGIKAFTAAVLGGIGNIVGAMVGGVALGVFEGVGPQLVLGGLDWGFPLLLAELLLAGAVALIWYRSNTPAKKANAIRALVAVGAAFVVSLAVPGLRSLAFALDIPGVAQLKDVVAFSALVLVLVFKPSGLLGEQLAAEDRA